MPTRLGLWVADLSVQQILQERVAAHCRGVFVFVFVFHSSLSQNPITNDQQRQKWTNKTDIVMEYWVCQVRCLGCSPLFSQRSTLSNSAWSSPCPTPASLASSSSSPSRSQPSSSPLLSSYSTFHKFFTSRHHIIY